MFVEVVHEIFCRRTLMEATLDEMSMGEVHSKDLQFC